MVRASTQLLRDTRASKRHSYWKKFTGRPCLTSGPTFVTLRPWKRTLSASDSRPTPGGPKAISYHFMQDCSRRASIKIFESSCAVFFTTGKAVAGIDKQSI
jgi:hypothetical protein